jgi:hypothetical protein
MVTVGIQALRRRRPAVPVACERLSWTGWERLYISGQPMYPQNNNFFTHRLKLRFRPTPRSLASSFAPISESTAFV